jgi:hypothetical protein
MSKCSGEQGCPTMFKSQPPVNFLRETDATFERGWTLNLEVDRSVSEHLRSMDSLAFCDDINYMRSCDIVQSDGMFSSVPSVHTDGRRMHTTAGTRTKSRECTPLL